MVKELECGISILQRKRCLSRHRLLGLIDQVAPIVHENAHFIFGSIDAGRLATLEHSISNAADGPRVWRLLREALPTAIAQGVAEQRFRRDDGSRERIVTE